MLRRDGYDRKLDSAIIVDTIVVYGIDQENT